MQIAIISMVRNEADIIESFVRHGLSFADKIYIVSHNSTDATGWILAQLVQEGMPIVVAEFTEAEQAQAEVMTKLMEQAFAEGFDFVLPLDADEFLLPDGGQDMSWCRKALISVCSVDEIYQLPWVTYQTEVEYSGARYILTESCRRESQSEDLGKLLLGRQAFETTKFFLSQGNHHALFKNGESLQRLAALPLQGVHLAHFSWRSQDQAASKAAVGWLANVAKYSRQTNLANHWRKAFLHLLAGEKPARPALRQGQKAFIHPNCQQAVLKYTEQQDKDIFLLRNVLMAAEQLADSYSEEKVLAGKYKVSIILPYLGQREAFKESWRMVLEDDYPYVNMVIFSLAALEDDVWLLEFLQQQSELIDKDIVYLQERGDVLWQDLKESADGEFIQWVFPGDLLVGHKLQTMVTTLVRHSNIDFVLTNSREYPELRQALMSGIIVDLQLPDGFAIGDGNIYRKYLRDNRGLLSGGLSAPLFRCRHMQRLGFLQQYMQGSVPHWQEIWQAVLQDVVIGAMAEPLVEMHSQL